MRSLFRRLQKCGLADLQYDPIFIDPTGSTQDAPELLEPVTDFDAVDLDASFAEFLQKTASPLSDHSTKALVYEAKALPG